MMKRITSLLLLATLLTSSVSAQVDSNSDLTKDFKLDFATPENPAFSILGTTPSTLLRPTNAKEFSSITSDWFSGKPPYVIPRSLGIEISPYLLMTSQKATLADYQKNRPLASLRFSVGTGEDDNTGLRNVAFGLRVSPIDEGDMRSDKAYLNSLTNIATSIAVYQDSLRAKYLRTNSLILANVLGDAAKKKEMDIWIYEQTGDSTEYHKQRNKEIEAARERYKRDNWNASKLDIAIAVLMNSPDSLLSNAYYKRSSFWLAGAIKPGAKNRNAQILLGLNINHEQKVRESIDTTRFHKISFALPARVYVGSNRYKGFVEFQYGFETFLMDDNSWTVQSNTLINGGAEINVSDGIWAMLSVGWNRQSIHSGEAVPSVKTSDFVYSVDLRFNLPEKFKLF
jgi:hypothetical protein